MEVMIAGGSGLIGHELTSELMATGDHVTILSRNPGLVKGLPASVRILQWNGKTLQGWSKELDDIDAVINLTGENLSGSSFPPSRWTKARKLRLVNSRIDSGELLSIAIGIINPKPSVFVQASGVGFYGTNQEKTLSEDDGGRDDFLANLCKEWEASSQPVELLGVRRVIIRNGVVLSKNGGALPLILFPYKLWVGGKFGSGAQVYSWIHIVDEARAIRFVIHNQDAQGVFNLVSPNPVTNDEFGRTISKVIKRPHYLSIPGFIMRLTLGEVSITVLEGQKVLPKKLMDMGFEFKFPFLKDALEGLLKE